MKYKKILILEAGGAAAISAIKLLRDKNFLYLIAADMDPNAAGLYLADKGIVVPPAFDDKFARSIQNIIEKYKIDLILPTFENGFEQLKMISGPFITDFDAAIKCKDKLHFFMECKKLGLPVPYTVPLNELKERCSFPKYIKPRFGSGSKDNYVINNFKQLRLIRELIGSTGQFIVQDLLKGDHWNVDVLVFEGKFLRAIPRRDIKQKEGNCLIVEVKEYPELIEFSKMVQRILSIKSVFNLEVFEVKPKKFVINEINVRFGGGVIFGALSGCDIVSYLVTGEKGYLGKLKKAIYSRYYEEIMNDPGRLIKYD